MKPSIFCILLMLPFAFAQGQKLVYPDSVLRGGSLRQGELRRTQFKVMNTSDTTAYLIVHKTSNNIALDTTHFMIPAQTTKTVFVRFQAPAKAGILEIPITAQQVYLRSGSGVPDSLGTITKLYLRAAVNNESSTQPSRKTNLQMDKMTYDFGTIPLGPDAKCRFTFTNTDSLPLSIESVKPNCGCISAGYSHQYFAPGESAEITFYYNTTNRPGHFNKGANIYFSSGVEVFVSMTGRVESEAEMLRFK